MDWPASLSAAIERAANFFARCSPLSAFIGVAMAKETKSWSPEGMSIDPAMLALALR